MYRLGGAPMSFEEENVLPGSSRLGRAPFSEAIVERVRSGQRKCKQRHCRVQPAHASGCGLRPVEWRPRSHYGGQGGQRFASPHS
jgi:hypothetical protein